MTEDAVLRLNDAREGLSPEMRQRLGKALKRRVLAMKEADEAEAELESTLALIAADTTTGGRS